MSATKNRQEEEKLRRWAEGHFTNEDKRNIEGTVQLCECEEHCPEIVRSRAFHKCPVFTFSDFIMSSAIIADGHRVCTKVPDSWVNQKRKSIWD